MRLIEGAENERRCGVAKRKAATVRFTLRDVLREVFRQIDLAEHPAPVKCTAFDRARQLVDGMFQ